MIAHQLDSVALLVSLLRFIVGSLHLRGLERLWQVVALCEVLGPLSNVCLQQRSVLVVLEYTLWVCVWGEEEKDKGGWVSEGEKDKGGWVSEGEKDRGGKLAEGEKDRGRGLVEGEKGRVGGLARSSCQSLAEQTWPIHLLSLLEEGKDICL